MAMGADWEEKHNKRKLRIYRGAVEAREQDYSFASPLIVQTIRLHSAHLPHTLCYTGLIVKFVPETMAALRNKIPGFFPIYSIGIDGHLVFWLLYA